MKAELAERIAAKKVLVVVGTGVSLAATGGDPLASWKGLITNGIERCVSLGWRDATWGDSQKNLLEGDLNDLLGVAEQVSRRLGWKPTEPCDGEWNGWLRHTVGSLHANHPELIEAIRDLGAPIATLNYDDLLGEVTHRRTITWQRAERWLPVLQGDDEAILHLHGHWREPSSVVLGIRSYDAMMDKGLAQHLQRTLASLQSLVFIGCRGTLEDPNFSSLLIWMREHLGGAQHSHYLLIREDEPLPGYEPRLREARIVPLRYGKEHADLLAFINNLAPTAPMAPARKKTLRKRSPWFRGRTQQMETLKSTIMGESRPGRAVVYGVVGVGKTELCIQLFYDHDIVATFGGNRYFVDLRDSKVTDIAFKISEALDLRISRADPLEHVKRELARSKSLLVLDSFQAPFANDQQGCAEFLRELVFDDPDVAGDRQAPLHLVVSLQGREWLATVLPWTTNVGLEPLDMVKDCTALFNDILNNKFANDPDLPRVINLTGGLPLIVELMAHYAETVPNLGEVVRRYRKALEQRYVPELIIRPDDIDEIFWGHLGQSLALALSDPRLKNEGRRLLSMLSCLPSGLAYEDVYDILPSDASRGMEQLEQTGLASQSRERDRLYLLEPIRAYVQRRDPLTETDFRSLTDYFLKLADVGNYVHKESGSIWRKKLASEFANIQTVLDKGLESHDEDLETRAMWAAVALGRYQRFAGRGSVKLLDKAISLPGNTRAINRALAESRRRRGSIRNTRAIKRSIALAECLRRRGSIIQMRSDPAGAVKDFESAKAIYEGLPQEVETTVGIAECVSNLAESKRLLSEDMEAIDLFKKALALFAQAKTLAAPDARDDKIARGEAFCYQRLGVLAQGILEYDEAGERYNRALELFTDIGDLIGKALCKKGIGDLETLSDKNMAFNSYDEALRLFEDAQFERGTADCRYSLGDLAFSRGDFEQALVMYQHARNGYEKADSEHGQANCIYSISDVQLCSGNYDRPEATDPAILQRLGADYEKAKAIFEKNNDYIAIGNCLQGISDVLVLQGDTERAASLRIKAATLVHLEFKNKARDDLLWVKPSGCFSGRWRK